MPVKPSSARQVDALVADLSSPDDIRREAAIARLAVLGARAVTRLALVVESDAAAAVRTAALRALEGIGDEQAVQTVLRAVGDADPTVASTAASAARTFLRRGAGAAALDRLTAAALDPSLDERVRLAAAAALGDLDRATLAPVWAALQRDANDALRAIAAARATGRQPAMTADPAADLTAAAEGALPDDPAGLQSAIARAGGEAPATTLHALVDRLRAREDEAPTARRGAWQAARGLAHAALARRGSRLALYDLKESVESAAVPLPPEFVGALATVGDASCLEPIAAAYAKAVAARTTGSGPWRQRLADAFRAIAARERVTRRHAVMKRIEKRWPGLLDRLR